MIVDEVISNGDGRESSQPNGTLNMANASSGDEKNSRICKRRKLESSVSTVGLSGIRVLFACEFLYYDDDDDDDDASGFD